MKKFIALVLIAVTVATMLCACGKSSIEVENETTEESAHPEGYIAMGMGRLSNHFHNIEELADAFDDCFSDSVVYYVYSDYINELNHGVRISGYYKFESDNVFVNSFIMLRAYIEYLEEDFYDYALFEVDEDTERQVTEYLNWITDDGSKEFPEPTLDFCKSFAMISYRLWLSEVEKEYSNK